MRRLTTSKITRGCQLSKLGQTGSTMIEYLLITIVLVTALISPIPTLGISVLTFLISAMTNWQNTSTYLLSLP